MTDKELSKRIAKAAVEVNAYLRRLNIGPLGLYWVSDKQLAHLLTQAIRKHTKDNRITLEIDRAAASH